MAYTSTKNQEADTYYDDSDLQFDIDELDLDFLDEETAD